MDLDTLIAIYVFLKDEGDKNVSVRRIWSQPWFLQRHAFGHANLLDEYRICPRTFREYMRMTEDSYLQLLNIVSDSIKKQDTIMRPSISVHDRLAATLRFLATGEKLSDLQARCNISRAALSSILATTLRAIVIALQNEVKLPQNQNEWKKIANDFRKETGFFPCLGAIDGKHVRIEKPPNSGSLFYCYKGYFSIHLLAIVDSDYKFLYCNVGANGSQADAGVLRASKFYNNMLQGRLDLPPNEVIAGLELQYTFLGDSGFALEDHILVPYHRKQKEIDDNLAKRFNARLSRARRIVECSFGHLRRRFGCFDTSLNLDIDTIEDVVLAACHIHNFLRRRKDTAYFTYARNGMDGDDVMLWSQTRENRRGIAVSTQKRMAEIRLNSARFYVNGLERM